MGVDACVPAWAMIYFNRNLILEKGKKKKKSSKIYKIATGWEGRLSFINPEPKRLGKGRGALRWSEP